MCCDLYHVCVCCDLCHVCVCCDLYHVCLVTQLPTHAQLKEVHCIVLYCIIVYYEVTVLHCVGPCHYNVLHWTGLGLYRIVWYWKKTNKKNKKKQQKTCVSLCTVYCIVWYGMVLYCIVLCVHCVCIVLC